MPPPRPDLKLRAKVLALADGSLKAPQIAKKCSCSADFVRRIVRENRTKGYRLDENSAPKKKIPTDWTDERVALLRQWWDEGLSASQIAANFSGRFSRNAVIGKVHRLKLPARSEVKHGRRVSESMRTKRPRRARMRPAPPPREPAPVPEAERSGAIEAIKNVRGDQCRWPMGDVRSPDFHFCGETQIKGQSYCPFHAAKAFYKPVSKPRRDKPFFLPVKENTKQFEGV